MTIQNARILHGESGAFRYGSLNIQNGRIAGFDCTDDDAFDAEGLYVLPGFIDTHIHGFVGVEFAGTTGDLGKAQEVLARDGVTGFAATVRCMPLDEVLAADRHLATLIAAPQTGAKILGIHNEGPFVSYKRTGAMQPPQIDCSVDAAKAMLEAGGGFLKFVTIAPEREGALDMITYFTENGVNATMGHTDATYAQAMAGIDAGAHRATHVFNAMRPFSHRETGILGAALTDDRVCCELIADFVHLDPAAVKLVYRTKGADNITLISDAGEQSGLPDGDYVVGGRVRHVRGGVCLTDHGVIAGSCFSMLKGAQNLRSLGIPLEEIAVMASRNPARALGVADRLGSIDIGKEADVIVCDDALNIRAVFVNGVKIEDKQR